MPSNDLRARAKEAAERSGPAVGNSAFIEGYLAAHEQLPGRARPHFGAYRAQIAELIYQHTPGCKPGDGFDAADAILSLIHGAES